MMTGDLGRVAIITTVVAGVVAAGTALLPRSAVGRKLGTTAFVATCVAPWIAMICLGVLFVRNQFQYGYVFNHGDSTTALGYKIAGIWTAQEGSFLLWACTTSLFGLLALRGAGALRPVYQTVYSLFLASLAGILVYESPFNLLKDVVQNGLTMVPSRGDGMTPSLQNYWVIIHPPTIFLGFGALAVPFALSFAAMIKKDATTWVAAARPWTILGFSILGLGLCMGGLWAYETQGWGGFWMWDPVENVSFVPWLLLVALGHGMIVQAVRGRWVSTNLLLGGLPFLSFVYGTFLTRSGLLADVSVHSFASMDRSALRLLEGILITVAAAFLGVWVWRGRKMAGPPSEPMQGLARENLYSQGVLLLSLLAAGISIGMSWPWFSALRSGKGAAIEEALYHKVVVWFFIPIMALIAVAPFVSWRAMGRKVLAARVGGILLTSIGLAGFLTAFIASPYAGFGIERTDTVKMPFGTKIAIMPWMFVLTFFCVFTAAANATRAVEIFRRSKLGAGAFVAHFGLAILLGGLVLSRGYERKERAYLRADEPVSILGYTLNLKGMESKSLDDREGKVRIDVTSADGSKSTARPGLYYYRGGKDGGWQPQVWPSIQHRATHDLYLAMSKPETDVFEKPLVLKTGETQSQNGLDVTYLEPVISGTPGQSNAMLGAKIRVSFEGQSYEGIPALKLQEGGATPSLVKIGPDLRAALLSMDAATRQATIGLYFDKPIYPVELFSKPFTGFVWLGTLVMTLGGFMSAASRRRRSLSDDDETPKSA